MCSIILLGLNDNEEDVCVCVCVCVYIYIYIYIYIFLFINSDASVEQKSNRKESSHTQRSCWESELLVRTDFSQNSHPHIILELPCYTHAILFFHCNACFLLAMVYTNAMLAFHWPWFTPMQSLFSIGHNLHPCVPCFQ